MNSILVTCYVNPDLDGVAGAIAYAEFLQKNGKNAVAGIIGELQDEAKYIFSRFNLEFPSSIENANDFTEVILVDASDLNGLEGKVRPEQVVEIIDHRKIHEADKFVNAKAQIELVGAAATLITEKFIQKEADISQKSTILLYSAIISNTLNFKGSVTTERDLKAAEWLNKKLNLPQDYWKDLFLAKSDLSGDKLKSRMIDDFAFFNFANHEVGIAQIEMIGAANLVKNRQEGIMRVLGELKDTYDLDLYFLNLIELEECKNYFVTDDRPTKEILEKILDVRFEGNLAKKPNLTMRKQIVPLFKTELEKYARNRS
ncbi:MAG: DHH family phosphoesterase [Patescibacteria group bacterium]|nr:DHH family phosphoesterase [Patescibacteria group bacterium]